MSIRSMLLSNCEDDFDLAIEVLKAKGYSNTRVEKFLISFFEHYDCTQKLIQIIPFVFVRVNYSTYYRKVGLSTYAQDPTKYVTYTFQP